MGSSGNENERPGANPAFFFSRHCERSEAIQLPLQLKKAGLLRRYAPRNDGGCAALLRRFRRRQRRIVRISLGGTAVERVLVPRVQRRTLLQALDEVGV